MMNPNEYSAYKRICDLYRKDTELELPKEARSLLHWLIENEMLKSGETLNRAMRQVRARKAIDVLVD